METRVAGSGAEVIISLDGPTVLIGERINPTGKKRLAEALRAGDLSVAKEEATSQVAAGADILDINVGATGVDEIDMLPRAVEAVAERRGRPTVHRQPKGRSPGGRAGGLPGPPIVNSVTGEESSLEEILPLVKQYGLPVIGLCLDEKGIPAERRPAWRSPTGSWSGRSPRHSARRRDHRLPDAVAGRQHQGRSWPPSKPPAGCATNWAATRPRAAATSRTACPTGRC